MTEEITNDNISSHSIDYMSHRLNKNLEIILEEKNTSNNNQNNVEENDNKSQTNFNKIPNPLLDIEQPKRYNSCEKRKKNKILQQKVKEILDYRAKFKSLEAEENLEEEILQKEEDDKKQKVESKVNRNLKLLNLIKEKMNQNKENKKDNDNENYKEESKINNNENNIDINNKEIIVENNNNNDEIKNENLIDKNEKVIDINEEKEKKLLQIFDKKQINNEHDNPKNIDIENNNDNKEKEKEKEQTNILDKEKEQVSNNTNNYHKRKIPHPNTGSVTYPTFMKKGTGNFHISTPKTKQQNIKIISKSNSKDKEKDKNNDNNSNKKDNKYSDIPSEQKNKLTIKINPKNISFTPDNSDKMKNNLSDKKDNNSENKIISLSNKKEEKHVSNNNNYNKKEGAMKILELLKAKKKEENENNKKGKNEEEKDKELMVPKENKNKIDSSLFNQNKNEIKNITKVENHNEEGIFDSSALPKKKFMEEEDEENDYKKNNYNRTQHVFRKNNKKTNQIENFTNDEKESNIYNSNNNNSSRIKTNYYNNINNNINNFFNIGATTNIPERKTIEYINNANLLRNKYNKKLKAFNSANQCFNEENDDDNDNNDDIFKVGNNSQINYIQKKNTMIDNNNLNIKNLDKSYDMYRTNKNKYVYKNINNPKKINNNDSPRTLMKYRPYEKNTADNFKRNGRIYNKINYKKITPTYVKKSPGKININNMSENRNQIKLETSNKNQIPFRPKINQDKYNKININNKKNNIVNNERMELSTIYGLNSSIETSTSNRTNNKNMKSNKTKKENSMFFNIEDLLVLEEKLNNITFSLESNKNIDSQCFNFWNYYFNCSIYKILEKIFSNEEDSNIIRLSINYELMSIMVCYDFAFSNNIEDEDLNLSLIELIYFNHNNLIIICEYILTKITPENTDNIWVLKLQEIVKNSKFSQTKETNNNNNSSAPIQKILNNTNKIIKKIKSILLNYQSDSTSLLKNYILNLPRKTYDELNNFFRSQILRIDNYEGSLVPPSFFKKNRDFTPFPSPYLQFPSAKPYTLILDLDETLVSFQIKSKKEGTLRARPFLFAFLEEMGHYYELIVWTSATEAYANSLVDAIEYDKQYFDFILFREHAIIIGDEFVKDLTRVGRGLDRIIIVDDMPQNFRLQKQNGITIKPFYGDDYNDTALYDLLPILKRIAEEGNDVRIELAKYREEIVRKITSNISLNDI